MSHKVNPDGSVTYSGDPSDNERKKALQEVARETGSVVSDEDEQDNKKAKESHPRDKASKATVTRETGTKTS